MKKEFIGILLMISSSIACALSAPQYLSVKGWKKCVAAQTKGEAQFICLPAARPAACAKNSWNELNENKLIQPCSI